jgi:AP-4 complex subunit mu-1
MAKVFKDYCGVLNEEAIRKNFILVYELVDEMLDFGYPQITSTEMLKSCIHNEAQMVTTPSMASSLMNNITSSRTKSSAAANMPITMKNAKGGNNKNEIYVDIIERLTVLFNANGYVINSAIDGSILMKSFLSGNPELRLALNEDLVIGKGTSYGSVILDDCIFHECVHLDEFESSRTLHFIPPDGEFAVLNYRVTTDFRCPFKIYPTIEDNGPYKMDVVIVVRAEIPDGNYGTNVTIRMAVPRSTVGATPEFNMEIPGSFAEYNSSEKKLIWSIRKFTGGSEVILRGKITLDTPVTPMHRKEIGPISMAFEIPMYNVSNLQVRYLRISETHKSYNPYRWVRYITQSSSYVCRL